MTLKLMQGFETVAGDNDLRTQGLIHNGTPAYTAVVPSLTGQAGYGIKGSFNLGSNATGLLGASGVLDMGVIDTGVTVNQAYNAGGLVLGMSCAPNTNYNLTTTPWVGSAANTLCYDPASKLYWTITGQVANGSGLAVATSPDLKTWTPCTAQPTVIAANATISFMGNGTVLVMVGANTASVGTGYWSSNGGATWTAQTFDTTSAAANSYGKGWATGNNTYPHAVLAGANGTSSPNNGLYIGTLGGTMTRVYSGSVALLNTSGGAYIDANYITVFGLSEIISSPISTMNNTPFGTTGTSWTAIAGVAGVTAATFHSSGNSWIIATGSGIFSLANPGTAGAPQPPTSATTTTILSQTSYVWHTAINVGTNTLLLGQSNVGNQNGVVISCINSTNVHSYATDVGGAPTNVWAGAHTGSNGSTSYVAVGGACWDGTRLVFCTTWNYGQYVQMRDSNSVVVSPDGINDFVVLYSPNIYAGATQGAYSGVGLCSSSTKPVSGSTWVTNSRCMWVDWNGTAVSTPTTFSAWTTTSTTSSTGTFTVPSFDTVDPVYFEFQLVPVAGTVNLFNLNYYANGSLVYSVASVPMASTSDSTSELLISFGRNQRLYQFDDIYVTLTDGVAPSGVLGPCYVAALRPTSDVSTAWTRTGGLASNAASVSQRGLTSESGHYVSSANAGDKDVYKIGGLTIPSNVTVNAVQVEGYFSAPVLTSSVTVNVGLKNSTTEVDSGNTTVAVQTDTWVSNLWVKDPSGNAWTPSSAQAVDVVINHVS